MENRVMGSIRSPTLDTVIMVEKTIEKYSGEYNRTEIWKRLPRKVMWQTYLIILGYLENINKIESPASKHKPINKVIFSFFINILDINDL